MCNNDAVILKKKTVSKIKVKLLKKSFFLTKNKNKSIQKSK